MKTIFRLAITSLALLPLFSYAQQIECLQLSPSYKSKVTIKPTNHYANCFKLDGEIENKKFYLGMSSLDSPDFKITIFSNNEQGEVTHEKSFPSFGDNKGGAITIERDYWTKNDGFFITHKEKLHMNKISKINYMNLQNKLGVIIEMSNKE